MPQWKEYRPSILRPKFAKNFLTETANIEAALKSYADEVRCGLFPEFKHGFQS